MKKLILTLMIATLLVGTVVAGLTFDNVQDLINSFNQYKSDREAGTLNIQLPTITYKGDKVCEMNYETEILECAFCYEFYDENLMNKDKMYDDCIIMPYDSTRQEINDAVEDKVGAYFKKPQVFGITEDGYDGETTEDGVGIGGLG